MMRVTSAAYTCTDIAVASALDEDADITGGVGHLDHVFRCVAAERAQLRSKHAAFLVVLTACILLAAAFYGTVLLAWA